MGFGNPSPEDSSPRQGKPAQQSSGGESECTQLDTFSFTENALIDPTLKLFERGTSADYDAIGELLFDARNVELGSLIGFRLARHLNTSSVALACDLMRLHSFPATRAFVEELARVQHDRLKAGESSVLDGKDFATLRKLLLEFALGEGRELRVEERHAYEQEIFDATLAPIAILRRNIDAQMCAVLVDAATRGGVSTQRNRVTLEMLLVQERTASEIVLSGEQAAAVAAILRDPLRAPFTLMQVGHLVDLWLAKKDDRSEPGRDLIRRQCVQDVYRHAYVGESFTGNEQRLYQSIRLLRNFNDAESRRALREVADGSGTVPALLANLCISSDGVAGAEDVVWRLTSKVSSTERRAALEVLAAPVSDEFDKVFAEVIPLYFQHLADRQQAGLISPIDADAERLALWEALVHRVHLQGVDSPLVAGVIEAAGSGERGVQKLLSGMMMVLWNAEHLPPVWWYDEPAKLELLYRSVREMHITALSHQVPLIPDDLVHHLFLFFCVRGQRAFGCANPKLW